jgi:hypothetical protein
MKRSGKPNQKPPRDSKPSSFESASSERGLLSAYMAEIGRRGGLKGGKARAAKLSARARKRIAMKAARSRWSAFRKSDSQN